MSFIRSFIALSVLLTLLLFSSPAHGANPVPLIVPPSPSAAAPGGAAFTLTVDGANLVFGSVVNWNGSPRATTFVSSTQLTAAILASDIAVEGTATITVTSPAPGGGVSNQEFFSIVPPASRISFGSYSVTNQAALTSNVVEGDFNNDGKLDIAVASGAAVYVLLGNGDGTFQPAVGTPGPAGSTLQGLSVADANNDGKLDLFATGTLNASTDFILTFFGKGDGTFQTPVETDIAPQTGLSLTRFGIADFNGDGVLDAAFTNRGQIVIYYGNSDGTFRPGSVTGLNVSYNAFGVLAVGDFRGQGSLSLVIALNDPTAMSENFLAVFDTAAGVPSPYPSAYPEGPGNVHTNSGCCSVVLADFNGDGKVDIAIMHPGVPLGARPLIEIALNSGSTTQSSFGSPILVANPNQAQGTLLAGDFNGDGVLDLAVGGFVFFGRGDGTFPNSTGSTVPGNLDFLLAGDFNGDGKPDLITGTSSLSGASTTALGILLQIPPQPDFAGSVSPPSATIALNGSANYTVNLQALFGFSSNVTLSVSGLPAGVTGNFVPATVTGGAGSSTLTLTANGSVTLGTYTITIAGTGGGITHSSSVQLLVNSSPGDFTGSVTPDTQNIAPGQSAVFTIAISRTGGFNGSVALTLSGALPSGSTYHFSPATITGGSGTSTLTVSTPTGLSPSVSYFTITATSGSIVRSHTVAVGVDSSGGDFTGTFTSSQTSPPTGVVQYIFSLQPLNGYNQAVTISFSGVPPGAIPDPPVSVIPGTPVGPHITLTNVAPGTYPLLVTLAGPGVVHQVTVQLVVN